MRQNAPLFHATSPKQEQIHSEKKLQSETGGLSGNKNDAIFFEEQWISQVLLWQVLIEVKMNWMFNAG
jgi:hypothetical protein